MRAFHNISTSAVAALLLVSVRLSTDNDIGATISVIIIIIITIIPPPSPRFPFFTLHHVCFHRRDAQIQTVNPIFWVLGQIYAP